MERGRDGGGTEKTSGQPRSPGAVVAGRLNADSYDIIELPTREKCLSLRGHEDGQFFGEISGWLK